MSTIFPASIASAYFRELPIEDAVTIFQEHDFHDAELAHEHVSKLLSRADELGKSHQAVGWELSAYLNEKSFRIQQGHLSFDSHNSEGLATPGYMDLLMRELELFDAIGIRNAVIHLTGFPDCNEDEKHERIVPYLSRLVEFLKGSSICLCIENLYRSNQCETYSSERILKYIDELGDENLGICLDTGHLNLSIAFGLTTETQRGFILRAGKHLKALHIANNDGGRDQHLLPFNNNHSIHWDEVMHALEEISYQGVFNLEIAGEHSSVTCPYDVKVMKLDYIRKLMNYMLSEKFLSWQGNQK